MAEGKLYDLNPLIEMIGDDDGLKQMLGVFVDSTPKTLIDLNGNLEANDYEMLAKNAHKMKASLDMLKINSLYDVIRKIDKHDKVMDNMNELDGIVGQINEVLEKVFIDLRTTYSL